MTPPRWLSFLMFISITGTLWVLVNYYVGAKLARVAGGGKTGTRLITWGMVALAFSYPIGALFDRLVWPGGFLGIALTVFGSYLIGVVSLAFTTYFLGDMAGLFHRLATWPRAKKEAEPPRFRKYVFVPLGRLQTALLSGVVVLAAAAALWGGLSDPGVRRVELKAPAGSRLQGPVRVALFSDVHIGRLIGRAEVETIVDIVNGLEPDLVLIPGDLFEDDTPAAADAAEALARLSPRLGIFMSTGNHENYVGIEFCTMHAGRKGVKLLRQAHQRVAPGLVVAAVDDRHFLRESGLKLEQAVQKALADVAPDTCVIMLTHRPEGVEEMAAAGADLIVAGHTHGGQIPPFQLFSPMGNHGYLHGLYEIGNAALYVTSGAGTWGPRMRLFAPSEIVEITILP